MARPTTFREIRPSFGRIMRHVRPYLRRYAFLMWGSLGALVASTALRLLEPWPLKIVVDNVFGMARPSGLRLDGVEPLTLMTLAAGMVLAVALLQAVTSYLSTVGFALVGNRLLTDVRYDLFRHLQRLSMSFHVRARTGDLTTRLVNDIAMLKEVAVTAMLPLMASALVLAGMLGVMFWLNWALALIAVAPLPLLWLSAFSITGSIQTVSRKQRGQEGSIAAAAAESMAAIKSVQALSIEDRLAGAFAQRNTASLTSGVQAKRLAARLERITDVLVAATVAGVLWYGAVLVLRGTLTPGELIVFLAYLRGTFRPVRDAAKYVGRLAKATASAERVIELLEVEPEVRDLPHARPAPPFRGAIRFAAVTFGYEPGRPALEAVDLEIAPGEWVAVVGPSGAGKSTLASLVIRLHDPATGQVLIDGEDIRHFRLDSLRSQISILLQDNLLFADTVRANIALGTEGMDPASVEEAARRANAHGFIDAMPDGYETVLAERGADLSGGQRQRLAVARAALRRSAILILDEPTTGLDRENADTVIDALMRVARGRTMLLITHDLDFAARADRIVYMEEGRIVEQGPHEELIARSGCYAALHRLRTISELRDRGGPYAVAS